MFKYILNIGGRVNILRLCLTSHSMLDFKTKTAWPRVALIKVECAEESPNDFLNMQILIQRVWNGAGGSLFLPGSQTRSLLVFASPC